MGNRLLCGLLAGLVAITLTALLPPATAAGQDYLRLGLGLMESESVGPLALGMTGGEVSALLGPAEQASPVRVWGADGREHQQWSYPSRGIELGLMKKDGNLVVDRVRVTGPCDYRTKRGVGVGTPESDARAAYREEIDPALIVANRLVVGSVYGGIIFGLQDGQVTSLFLGPAAE